jgi:hypothetical protein
MDSDSEITLLKAEIEKQKHIINDLESKLKKYTNNQGHKKYLEEHKDQIKEIQKKYFQKLKEENPEKLKEYYQRANQKRKEKKIQQTNISENNNN